MEHPRSLEGATEPGLDHLSHLSLPKGNSFCNSSSRLAESTPGGAALLMGGLSPQGLKVLAANSPHYMSWDSLFRECWIVAGITPPSFSKPSPHDSSLCFSLSFPQVHAGASHRSCSQNPAVLLSCCEFLTPRVCSTPKIAFVVSSPAPGPSAWLLTAEGASLIHFGRTVSPHQPPRNS